MKLFNLLKNLASKELLALLALNSYVSIAFATGSSAPADAPAYKEPITDTDLGQAPKVGHRIVFEHPLVLDAKKVPINVTRLVSEFNEKSQQFDLGDHEDRERYCNIRLAIQGRDIALNNTNIGEHYFGKMQLSCAQSGRASSFTTTFSRVLVLGIRNCVESETMVDQDYCNLYVIALRKKTDVKESNGDLIRDTGNILEKYVISKSDARDDIVNGGFMPVGVNEDSIDSFQTFKLSIGKNAGEYFIPPTTGSSSMGQGKSYYLHAIEDTTRQSQVEDDVRTKLTELEAIVQSIRASSNPQREFDTRNADYFNAYAATAKILLEVVHPVTFYRFEAHLKGIESSIIAMVKTWDSTINSQDSFLGKYSSALGEYERLRGYYSENAKVDQVDYSKLISVKVIPPPIPEDKRLKQSFVGKIFEGSSVYLRMGPNARMVASEMCENYLNEHAKEGTADLFRCDYVRDWESRTFFTGSQIFYAQYKIVIRN